MNRQVQPIDSRPNALVNRQQTLFVRAIIGSLMLYAALGAPAGAQACFGAATPEPEILEQVPSKLSQHPDPSVTSPRDLLQRTSHHCRLVEPVVLNNMTVSASGKHMALKLEMSREQVGNLLRQHVSLP